LILAAQEAQEEVINNVRNILRLAQDKLNNASAYIQRLVSNDVTIL
jgi:hypothetical protein